MTKEILNLDSLLKEWPLASRADQEWDEQAERIARAATSGQMATSSAISEEALFAAPLAQLPEEGQSSDKLGHELGMSAQPGATGAAVGRLPQGTAVESKMGNSSERGGRKRSSFSDLAKLAGSPMTPTPPPAGVVRGEESSKDDSGIVDLKAIAGADPEAEQRAKATALASEGLFDNAPSAAAAPPSSGSAVAPSSISATSTPASAGPAAVAAVPAVSAKSEKKKGSGGIVIALFGLVGVAAVAAGAFFFIQHKAAESATASHVTDTKPVVAVTATPSATVATVDSSATDDQPDLAPDPAHKGMPRFTGKLGTVKPGAGAAPSSTVDPSLVFNMPGGGPQTSTGTGGNLDDEMAKRVDAKKGGTLTPAAATTGNPNAPPKPSQGQVSGAISVVLPTAKACLSADDPISKATVVFQSDGTVLSVTVTGFAAGKPAEGCVRSALSKAKVPAFSEASYAFPVTIRGTN